MDSSSRTRSGRIYRRELKRKLVDEQVFTAKFNDGGNFIVSGGANKGVNVWRYSDVSHCHSYGGSNDKISEVRDVCLSKDDSKLAACYANGDIVCYDFATGGTKCRFGHENFGHENMVNAIMFNESGSILASGDTCVRLWDCRSHSSEPIQIFETFVDCVTSLHLTRAELIAGSLDGTIQLYDLRKNKRLSHELGAPVKSIHVLEGYMLASCLDSTIRFLQVDANYIERLGAYKGHRCETSKVGCCFTPNSGNVISGSEDGYIFYWDLMTGDVVAKIDAHSSTVTSVEYHPTDDSMLSASMDGSIVLWKDEM